jgi:hypothetical protein
MTVSQLITAAFKLAAAQQAIILLRGSFYTSLYTPAR